MSPALGESGWAGPGTDIRVSTYRGSESGAGVRANALGPQARRDIWELERTV